VGVKLSEVATPLASTTLVEENTWLVHAWSLKSLKVTPPVGTPAPARLAVSFTAVPSGPPSEGSARMTTARRSTTMVKVWHAGAVTALVAHTVEGPNVPAWVGRPARMPLGPTVRPGGRVPDVSE
jgi:hypothetical protein